MVALSLLDKALLQLRVQRSLDFSSASVSMLQPKTQPAACNEPPQEFSRDSSPMDVHVVHWAPSLELSGGHHQPWAVQQPEKTILKQTTDNYVAQTGLSNNLALPPPLCLPPSQQHAEAGRSSADEKQRVRTCVKILSQKRSRKVAFAM